MGMGEEDKSEWNGDGHLRGMEAEGIYLSKRPRKENDEEDVADVNDAAGLRPWENASSRIIRVSRISGGKDRHSKVWTAKGLRDRRVRLSVSTAIQFYDLQDRLGLDQPSKAVDWLVKAAAAAISHLPELDGAFPMPPTALVLPGRAKILLERSAAANHQISPSKSTCSTASETSKGGGKLRECAGERAAKEKEKDQDAGHYHQNLDTQSSFTELLIAGGGSSDSSATGQTVAVADYGAGFGQKLLRPPLGTSTTDYFGQGGISGNTHKIPQLAPGYSSLLHFGNNHHMGVGMRAYNPCAAGEHHEMQQFSFMQDHVIPVAAVAPRGDYDLNVSISSGFAGFNRGTLQSNSPHHHHIVDGGNLPFFFGTALPITAAAGASSEIQYPGSFNGRLQVCCNEGYRHSELKEERKG